MAAKTEYPLSLVIKAIDKATAPLRKVNEQISEMTAPVRQVNNGLRALAEEAGLPKVFERFKAVRSAAGKFASDVGALALKFGALTAGAGFALFHIIKGSVDAGDKLGEMAQRVGLTVDAYAQLQFAAAQADVEQEQFNDAMDKFNVSLGQAKAGGGPLLGFLKSVSPALANQIRHAKGTEEAFTLMTKAMEKVTDPSKRAALAQAAFGKGGKQFGQFLGQGTKAIEEQRKRYFELSGSQEQFAKGAGDLDNAMREAQTAFQGLTNAAAGGLFPALTILARAVADIVGSNQTNIRAWAQEAGAAIKKWVDEGGPKRLADSIREMARTIADVVEKIGGWKNALILVAAVMAGPTLASTASLTLEIGKLGFSVLAFISKVSGFTGWAATWIQYLWMMRASIMAGLIPSLTAGAVAVWAFVAPFLPIIGIVAGVAALARMGYVLYKQWEPTGNFFKELLETIKQISFHPLDSLKTAATFWKDNFFGSQDQAPMLNAQRPGASSTVQTNNARVTVDFANMPKGARATIDPRSDAAIDMSMGPSMVTP